ncbi:MAG TPA: hypothetical protein VJ773_06555 [Gemmatimonadales bacterium]|nr:hypothetical protein [Gemmatimonadales bacterium]
MKHPREQSEVSWCRRLGGAGNAWKLLACVGVALIGACTEPKPTAPAEPPELVIRGHNPPARCVPEVIESATDSTETVLVTFTVDDPNGCYPNLVDWGIDMADPVEVDTPQGSTMFQTRTGLNYVNMPSPPYAAIGAHYTPPRVMIEFDPPVRSVEFYYSRLSQARAVWGGDIVEADSMRVRAMSRIPGTLFYNIYDTKTLYSNVSRTTPPWDTWTYVKFSASSDKIQWLWFDGTLVIDDLKIVRRPFTCTSPLQRGQVARCELASPSLTISSWRFQPDDPSLPEVQTATPNAIWQGVIATSGLVSVSASDGVATRTYTARIDVVDRSWDWPAAWSYREGPELTVSDHEVASSEDAFGRNCPEKYAGESLCVAVERSRLQPDPFLEPDSGFNAAMISSGPNQGYWYVATIRSQMKRVANVNPGLLATSPRQHPVPTVLLTKACKRGLGVKPNATAAVANMNQFNQFCGPMGTDMSIFVPAIWGHEGFGYGGGSGHETLARQAAGEQQNDPYSAIEQFVRADSSTLAAQALVRVRAIGDDITRRAKDHNPINGGPQGNYDPAAFGTEMWFWEIGESGELVWARRLLTSRY